MSGHSQAYFAHRTHGPLDIFRKFLQQTVRMRRVHDQRHRAGPTTTRQTLTDGIHAWNKVHRVRSTFYRQR